MASGNRPQPIGPAAAQAALDGVSAARANLADRISSPWWYHPAMGASIGLAPLSAGISWELIPYGVCTGFLVLPMLLTLLLKRSTGVVVDHYTATPGARRLSARHALLVLALLILGGVLQWGLDLRWAGAGTAVAIFALTVWLGRRIESALHRDVRAGA